MRKDHGDLRWVFVYKVLLMAGEELIEIKFRLFDGTDIGPNKYHPATTVESLKEIILTQWPQG